MIKAIKRIFKPLTASQAIEKTNKGKQRNEKQRKKEIKEKLKNIDKKITSESYRAMNARSLLKTIFAMI